MSESYQSDILRFHRELDICYTLAKTNKARLKEHPLVEKQITFWIEGTRFLISELEIWERMGNLSKCDETVYKVQQALDHLHELLE